MNEVQLDNGARVRVRPIPPHVVIQFNRNVQDNLPPEPTAPKKQVPMADGHIEQDVVPEDSQEWQDYQAELEQWRKACDDAIAEANHEYNNLQRDFAIIEWSFDGEYWRRDVPEAWEYPAALERAGIAPCGNLRVDYIGIELITTVADWERVRNAAEGNTAPITDQEAARVRAGFRAGSGPERHTATKKQGWFRRLALKVSRRNASSKGVEPHARPMVQ